MEFLTGEALYKYLLGKYSKNPRGWNYSFAPSTVGSFFDGVVTGPDEIWQLKIDSVFKPSPIVIGSKIEPNSSNINPEKSISEFPSYGYRQLDPEALLRLLNSSSSSANPPSTVSDFDRILKSIEPVSPQEGKSYAQGPFLFSRQSFRHLSENQRTLDEKLTSQLKNILRDKYTAYG